LKAAEEPVNAYTYSYYNYYYGTTTYSYYYSPSYYYYSYYSPSYYYYSYYSYYSYYALNDAEKPMVETKLAQQAPAKEQLKAAEEPVNAYTYSYYNYYYGTTTYSYYYSPSYYYYSYYSPSYYYYSYYSYYSYYALNEKPMEETKLAQQAPEKDAYNLVSTKEQEQLKAIEEPTNAYIYSYYNYYYHTTTYSYYYSPSYYYSYYNYSYKYYNYYYHTYGYLANGQEPMVNLSQEVEMPESSTGNFQTAIAVAAAFMVFYAGLKCKQARDKRQDVYITAPLIEERV
jgi:hypothetical protein